MAIVQTGLTLDEFLRQPDEKPALEYLDGVVTRKLSPKGPHGRLQVVLLVETRQRRVRVARAGQPLASYQGDDAVTIEDVPPGFSFTVRELFSTLRVRRPHEGEES